MYGIHSAPGIFQSIMDKVISGLSCTADYQDDALTWGSSKADCAKNVDLLLQRLQAHKIRINMLKCK